ncbi:MAG TPA: serine/threonine-protein kinase, partial [Phycisphaerae bacterium]|nr:serine/threonine-protein kinase [Phycisphaerae bacterium]
MVSTQIERERRALAIVGEAVELSASEQFGFVEAHCDGDSELRAQVDSLLKMNDRSWHGLTRRPGAVSASCGSSLSAGDDSSPQDADLPIDLPERIGRYRILGVLGTGGMGIVYRAEQESPHRLVALKVMRRPAGSRMLSERFRREAGTLAQLNHPYIAQVFDAGSIETPSGPQLYFAMQLVEGPTLRQWVNQSSPQRDARLRLFIHICEAVQHAHQSGVIHRDLKPENILVEKTPEGPRPRVLDFGVARLLPEMGHSQTLATEPGQIVGSLPYISPEQMRGVVDTRVDVYALGVLLFEMLTGQLPIRVSGLTILEAIEAIRNQAPAQ